MNRNLFNRNKHPKKVHLVLGSGGARGIAHIAVIEKLLEDGYEIVSVVGCSMGAVVGGIYCTGHLPVYRDWLLTLNRNHIFNLLDFTLTNVGFVKGDRILGKMHDITGDQQIEKLRIPFVAVATDVVKGEEVYFQHGDLYQAMRASISIPGVFTPVTQGGSVLVDGGVLNPLPLNAVNKSKDAIVVAVSLNGRADDWHTEQKSQSRLETLLETDKDLNHTEENHVEKTQEEAVESSESKNWWLKHLPVLKSKPKEGPKYSIVNLLANSYEFTQDRLVEMTIERYKPDLVIDIPRSSCGIYDFHKASQMMEIGRDRYRYRMDEYLFKQQKAAKKWLF